MASRARQNLKSTSAVPTGEPTGEDAKPRNLPGRRLNAAQRRFLLRGQRVLKVAPSAQPEALDELLREICVPASPRPSPFVLAHGFRSLVMHKVQPARLPQVALVYLQALMHEPATGMAQDPVSAAYLLSSIARTLHALPAAADASSKTTKSKQTVSVSLATLSRLASSSKLSDDVCSAVKVALESASATVSSPAELATLPALDGRSLAHAVMHASSQVLAELQAAPQDDAAADASPPLVVVDDSVLQSLAQTSTQGFGLTHEGGLLRKQAGSLLRHASALEIANALATPVRHGVAEVESTPPSASLSLAQLHRLSAREGVSATTPLPKDEFQHALMSITTALATLKDAQQIDCPNLSKWTLALLGQEMPSLHEVSASTATWAASRLEVGSVAFVRGVIGRWHPTLGSVACGETATPYSSVLPSLANGLGVASSALDGQALASAARAGVGIVQYMIKEGIPAAAQSLADPTLVQLAMETTRMHLKSSTMCLQRLAARNDQEAVVRGAVMTIWAVSNSGLLPMVRSDLIDLVKALDPSHLSSEQVGILFRAASRAAVMRVPEGLHILSWNSAGQSDSVEYTADSEPWVTLCHPVRPEHRGALAAVAGSSSLLTHQVGMASIDDSIELSAPDALRDGAIPLIDAGADELLDLAPNIESSRALLASLEPLLQGAVDRMDLQSVLAVLSAASKPGGLSLPTIARVVTRGEQLLGGMSERELRKSHRVASDLYAATTRILSAASRSTPGALEVAWTTPSQTARGLMRKTAHPSQPRSSPPLKEGMAMSPLKAVRMIATATVHLGEVLEDMASGLQATHLKAVLGSLSRSPLRAEWLIRACGDSIDRHGASIQGERGDLLHANALSVALHGLVCAGPDKIPDLDVVRKVLLLAQAILSEGVVRSSAMELRALQNILWAASLASLLRERTWLPWRGIEPSLNQAAASTLAGYDSASPLERGYMSGHASADDKIASDDQVLAALHSLESRIDQDQGVDLAEMEPLLPAAGSGVTRVSSILVDVAQAVVNSLAYDNDVEGDGPRALRHPAASRRLVAALMLASQAVSSDQWRQVVSLDDSRHLLVSIAQARALAGQLAATGASHEGLYQIEFDEWNDMLGWPAWAEMAEKGAARRVALPAPVPSSLWLDHPGTQRALQETNTLQPVTVDRRAYDWNHSAQELSRHSFPSDFAVASMWSGVQDAACLLPSVPDWPFSTSKVALSKPSLKWTTKAATAPSAASPPRPGSGASDSAIAWPGVEELRTDKRKRVRASTEFIDAKSVSFRLDGAVAASTVGAWTAREDLDAVALEAAEQLRASVVSSGGPIEAPVGGTLTGANAPLAVDMAWSSPQVALMVDLPGRYIPPDPSALLSNRGQFCPVPGMEVLFDPLAIRKLPRSEQLDIQVARQAMLRAVSSVLNDPLQLRADGALPQDSWAPPDREAPGPAWEGAGSPTVPWPDPLDARERLFNALLSPPYSLLRLRGPVVAHHRLLEQQQWAVARVPWFLWTRCLMGTGSHWAESLEPHSSPGGILDRAHQTIERLQTDAAGRRTRAATLVADVVMNSLLTRQTSWLRARDVSNRPPSAATTVTVHGALGLPQTLPVPAVISSSADKPARGLRQDWRRRLLQRDSPRDVPAEVRSRRTARDDAFGLKR
jgi:hypothetical protein